MLCFTEQSVCKVTPSLLHSKLKTYFFLTCFVVHVAHTDYCILFFYCFCHCLVNECHHITFVYNDNNKKSCFITIIK